MNGDYFIGIILPFPSNSTTAIPSGWMPCDGRELKASDYGAANSIIGTQFGGVPGVTFKLPNLNGAVAIGAGQGPNLSNYTIGQTGGTGAVALTQNQLPPHSHSVIVSASGGSQNSPGGNFIGLTTDPSLSPAPPFNAFSSGNSDGQLNSQTIQNEGIGNAHNNLMPSLTIQYIICLIGSYPSPQ